MCDERLENLNKVMTLYSRGTFGKDSFQWTKCVVKYLYDVYSDLSNHMVAFLVEVSHVVTSVLSWHILIVFSEATHTLEKRELICSTECAAAAVVVVAAAAVCVRVCACVLV